MDDTEERGDTLGSTELRKNGTQHRWGGGTSITEGALRYLYEEGRYKCEYRYMWAGRTGEERLGKFSSLCSYFLVKHEANSPARLIDVEVGLFIMLASLVWP